MTAATAMQTQVASADNIVEVRGITKFYGGDVHALDSIDLGFPTSQMTTLLGPSGCGKTTLLKIIAGLLDPSAGAVLYHDLRAIEGCPCGQVVRPTGALRWYARRR